MSSTPTSGSSPGKDEPQDFQEFEAVLLPSVTPSEASPYKEARKIPEESLTAPDWENKRQAVSWFLKLRKCIKNLINRFCDCVRSAMRIFQENDGTHYSDNLMLSAGLHKLWINWKTFETRKAMTKNFLEQQTFLATDLKKSIRYMKKPKNSPATAAEEMRQIREMARNIAVEAEDIWELIQEAILRQEEYVEGQDLNEFPALPQHLAQPGQADVTQEMEWHEEHEEEFREDEEETQEHFVARGGIRDPTFLNLDQFDPVWMTGERFVGEMTPDMREMVGKGGSDGIQAVGSIRSIFSLSGRDDIVEMIDDPAFAITDELATVPLGTSPADFLISHYSELGKLPRSVERKSLGFVDEEPLEAPETWAVFAIPQAVRQNVTTQNLRELYPWQRHQCFPQQVQVVSVKHHKDPDVFHRATIKQFENDLLEKEGIFFRGLSLYALELSMAFFVPVIQSANRTNELGPGIYTTTNFNYAKAYAGAMGAIMVFQKPDFRDLEVWHPESPEWRHVVAHHPSLPHPKEAPERYRTADVIIGPTSERRTNQKGGSITQSAEVDQQAYVSHRACERLSGSLQAIIFIKN